MNIKPGMLCYVVGSLVEQWNGRVVTTGKYRPIAKMRHVLTGEISYGPGWQISAAWLPQETFVVRPERLRPINDPDAPAIEDETEALDDEIQRVRQMAGLV